MGLWLDPFIQSRKFMSSKFRGEFCVIWILIQNLKRNWLVSSKLTWRIRQILTRALKNPKNWHFNRLLLTKVYNAWAKKSIEELCLMALKLMQDLKETDLCFLKIFVYRLKNSNFILESKMAELNWKQNFLIYFENCQDVPNSHE